MENENQGSNWLTQVHLEKWPLKRSVCVCVRHWAVDVESGNGESGMEHNSTCSLFSVIITLTVEGLDQLCLVHFIAFILAVSMSMLCTVCQGNKSVARLLIHVGILS